MQLARFVERITRNFGEKRLTGAVFHDVAKPYDTAWIDGFLYNSTLLNFPSYIVHKILSYLRGHTFEASFQAAKSSRQVIRAVLAHGGLIHLSSSVCMSTCLNTRITLIQPSKCMIRPSEPRYAADTARQPPESFLNELQRRLREWRIAILWLSDERTKSFKVAIRRTHQEI